MAFSGDLTEECDKIFRSPWSKSQGQKVPEPEDLPLGNHAVELIPATVLYADLDGSTNMVDTKSWQIAAEVYKTYLLCATRVIRSCGGAITSFDGDRVMGIFIGGSQSSTAAQCSLKINYAVQKIFNPRFKQQYSHLAFEVVHVVGIDRSEVRATRTGIRGNNDIVWVGRAPNYAAKLTSAGTNFRTWITEEVYDKLNESSKYGGSQKQNMWTARYWTSMNNKTVYGSNWTWNVDT